jgi:hypothetical protein
MESFGIGIQDQQVNLLVSLYRWFICVGSLALLQDHLFYMRLRI